MSSGIQPPTPDKQKLEDIITVNSKMCRLEVITQFVTLKPTWKAPGFLLLHYKKFTISSLLLQLSHLSCFPFSALWFFCGVQDVFFHPVKLTLPGRKKVNCCLLDCPSARSQGHVNTNVSTGEGAPAAPGLRNRVKVACFSSKSLD